MPRPRLRDRFDFIQRASEAAEAGKTMEEFLAGEEEREGMDVATIAALIKLLFPLILMLFDRD